jgi:hypothetical protein
MEGQPQEKMIHELSGEELKAAIETGRQRLEEYFSQIAENPDKLMSDAAKEAASQQFDGLIALYEKLGDERRLQNETPDENRFQGDGAEMIPAYIRKETDGGTR